MAYPAHLGFWGIILALTFILLFDLDSSIAIRSLYSTLLWVEIGLITIGCVNFVLRDFAATQLSHGAAATLLLLILLFFAGMKGKLNIKRLFDVIASGTAIILLSPIVFLTAAMVRVFLGSPVLFRQLRPGLQLQPFQLIKFRTMTNARNASGELLPDKNRLTPFGHFLRASSLDELPELLNVLKGDMSLVGPRPLLMEYIPLYNERQARRHEVKPGLTGWAQVNGRNTLTWEERFELDLWYVENWSFWLDLKIISMTVWRVLRREGINQTGSVSMEKFRGSRPSEAKR